MSLGDVINWIRVVQLHHHYQQLYPDQYYLLRFEDLITDPETELEKLCHFLGIGFMGEMLQSRVVNSSFVSAGDRQKGFDTSAIDRWQQHLHPVTNKLFVSLCRKRLLELGYVL